MIPNYEHDSDCCTFLGRGVINHNDVDMYYCESDMGTHLLIRYSSKYYDLRSATVEEYLNAPEVYSEYTQCWNMYIDYILGFDSEYSISGGDY